MAVRSPTLRAEIPGLLLRDLLTIGTLDRRLRHDRARWERATDAVRPVPAGADWRAVLGALGYRVDGRPGGGHLLRWRGRPVAVVHAKTSASELGRLDVEGRPPEGALLVDCIEAGVPYGLLTAGARCRLFDLSGEDAGMTSRYLELDADVLRPADRPFLALLGPAHLAEGGFASLVAEVASHGAGLRRRLDERIRRVALPALARGLEAWAAAHDVDLARESRLAELERAAMTQLVRLLFLLIAESARYLPADDAGGQPCSIAALVREAAGARGRLDGRSTSLWDRAQAAIRAVDGMAAAERISIADPEYADVLHALGHDVESDRGDDHATLRVGHLGHIYEALLALRLTVDAASGSLRWTSHAGGRKSGGVHYTRTELVRHLVGQSVEPAFERHLGDVRALAERDAAAGARHLLDFAVVDPACGSAHFLVEVVRVLADRTVRFLAGHPLPELGERVARLRAGALAGSTIDDAALIRRLVLNHCVHGVDISPMAAEVARLSLCLGSFVPGLGPADLGENLRVGNSLLLPWPAAFPRVFARGRPGFDAVVGNPPWDEVMVDDLQFYGLHAPGIRALAEDARTGAIAELLERRPELVRRLREAKADAAAARDHLRRTDSYRLPGFPDLYRLFCARYRELLRDGGELGVVLPRSAFVAAGSSGFREWLFERMTCHRIDLLVNRRLWVFDTHPQYTIALVSAAAREPPPGHRVRVAGVAESLEQWGRQSASDGVRVPEKAFGPGHMVPLVRDEAEARLLAQLRRGDPFPLGPDGRWQCFGVQELNETFDRGLWANAREGVPLWKGESFDQYHPSGVGARPCPVTPAVLRRVRKPRPGSASMVGARETPAARRASVLRELGRARVAFRDVSRATDSRTIRACLVPPAVLLTNKAPYLTFVRGGPAEQAACLAVMNSIPFDWQARRYIETNVNFFIIEALCVPRLSDDDLVAVARAAARLSCVDDRFTDFAAALGIEPVALVPDAREQLRIEIDARVARAWNLTSDDLTVMLRDFTRDAVPSAYRARLLARLGEL
jgi:Eco57I restriction-modification methylase